jgi:ABC-type multidrug transport system ATPase subunit
MPGDIILQTSGLGKQYGKRWAVQNLDLQVRRGEIFGFLGPNGAGKSTTIRMLLTLIGPTTGRVELFGLPLPEHRREALSRVGGLVERADLYLYLSGRRNLEIVGALKGGLKRGAIDQALEAVGLTARANDRVKTYSHGMKQRLGVAQALLGDPECIILDEPTTGLDPQGIKEMRELIVRLSRERGITIFLSSHLLSEIEQTATSMAIINGGILAVQGGVRDLLNSSENSVRIEASPLDTAMKVLQGLPFVRRCEQREGSLEVKMPFTETARANAALVAAGVEVAALVPRRSLEEYFLTITEGASDTIRPPAVKRP